MRTTKYTLLTFIPLSIFYQYTRFANLYFLVLCILVSIPSVATWSPISQIGPTVVVLMISILREAVEDIRRFKSDTTTNNQIVTLIKKDGSEE